MPSVNSSLYNKWVNYYSFTNEKTTILALKLQYSFYLLFINQLVAGSHKYNLVVTELNWSVCTQITLKISLIIIITQIRVFVI